MDRNGSTNAYQWPIWFDDLPSYIETMATHDPRPVAPDPRCFAEHGVQVSWCHDLDESVTR